MTAGVLAVVCAVLAQLAVGLGTATHASPTTGSADDRLLDTPTSWWEYTGQSPAQLNSQLVAHNARLTDLHADPGGATFSATLVSNAGAYASGWWWYYGKTASQVGTLLSTNHARLISADAYTTPAGVRWAVVMVPNSGANATAWWWYYNASLNQISNAALANRARLIQLTPYPGSNSGYIAVMVDNTGPNALAWSFYDHQTANDLYFTAEKNDSRPIDLSRNSDGTFNAIMYGSGTPFGNDQPRWSLKVDQTLSALTSQALQHGERIIDITRYGNLYAAVEVRNLNDFTESFWELIGGIQTGTYGFYLKQVNGPVLTGLNQTLGYEPASALKVLYHAYSIHQESLGLAHDTDPITFNYNPALDMGDPKQAEICPDKYASTTSTTDLATADSKMMIKSDNRMTKGVLYKYGAGNFLLGALVMESYAHTLGLTNTHINHNIGCPTATNHNVTTLVDLGKIYEAYQNGGITTNPTWKAQFWTRMLNEQNYNWLAGVACPLVKVEAAKLGKSPEVATQFCNDMTWISKGGSYTYGSEYPLTVSDDAVSLTEVPFKGIDAHGNHTIVPRYYIFGEFIDGVTVTSVDQRAVINTARNNEALAALTYEIDAGLQTW